MKSEVFKYAKAFSKLKRGVTPNYGLAPHKPILLLSIIDLIERGELIENKVKVNQQLVSAFLNFWRILVDQPFKCDFTQPFYYLQNDKVEGIPFWQVNPLPGCQLNAHIKSFDKLITVVDFGYFSSDLFDLLMINTSREYLKQTLLETYFPNYKRINLNEDYISELSSDILNEPVSAYKKTIISFEEEVFVRNGLFRKLVPQAYDQTCAFTGWRVQTASGLSLVDACHIKPFSICKEDHIKNGISLSPNIHRAFDRGMLSIDDNYCIIISSQIIEDNSHALNLRKLEGQKIKLPFHDYHYPGLDNLKWHRDNCFKV